MSSEARAGELPFSWTRVRQASLPAGAVTGGHERLPSAGGKSTEVVYHVCRGEHDGEVHVGRLHAASNCVIASKGLAVPLARFEVLTASAPASWISVDATKKGMPAGFIPVPGVCRAVHPDDRLPGEMRGGACFFTDKGAESVQTSGFEILGTEPPASSASATKEAPVTLHVTEAPHGLILMSTGAMTCPDLCAWSVPKGSTVHLTAKPEKGFVALRWGGDCDAKDATSWSSELYPSCSVVMDGDRHATATFAPGVTLLLDYPEAAGALTWVGAGNAAREKDGAPSVRGLVTPGSVVRCGMGDARCSLIGPEGARVLIKAQAAKGFALTGWSESCSMGAVSADQKAGSCLVELEKSTKVSAIFAPVPAAR